MRSYGFRSGQIMVCPCALFVGTLPHESVFLMARPIIRMPAQHEITSIHCLIKIIVTWKEATSRYFFVSYCSRQSRDTMSTRVYNLVAQNVFLLHARFLLLLGHAHTLCLEELWYFFLIQNVRKVCMYTLFEDISYKERYILMNFRYNIE